MRAGGCSRRASDGAPAGSSSPRATERRRPTGCSSRRHRPQALLWPDKPWEPTLLSAAMQRRSKAQRAHICDQRTYDVLMQSAHECSRAYSHATGGGRPTVKATAYTEECIIMGLAAQMLSAAVQQSAAARPTSERATQPVCRAGGTEGSMLSQPKYSLTATSTDLNGAEAARTISASLGGWQPQPQPQPHVRAAV